MKKFLLGTVALAALTAAPAMAADMRMPTKAPPAPVYAPIYNWTGFYLGGHIGVGFGNGNDIAGFASDNNTGFLGGGQIGADWQFAPNWVLGIEGQASWFDGDQNWTAPGIVLNRSQDWLGSITGRLGYTWGPGLIYAKGGVAFTNGDYTLAVAGVPFAFTGGNDSTGWTVGAGLEYLFAPNWSAKLEYQYYDFGSTTLIAPGVFPVGGVNVDDNVHTIKLGVNYRFNWGAPVVAKY